MKLKILAEDKYVISAIMDGDACPVEDALLEDDPAYGSYSVGLLDMLERVAKVGFEGFSSKQSHYINEDPKIFEFIRGPLRLIYFHGKDNNVVVSTEVVKKKSKKADKKVVKKAIQIRKDYFESIQNDTLIEIRDDENQNE
jgi:hypothetical protein